jgi:hypothetical protein
LLKGLMACRSWCGAKRRRTPASRAMRLSSERAAAADHGRPCVGPLTTQVDRFRDRSNVSFGFFRTDAHALESVGLED